MTIEYWAMFERDVRPLRIVIDNWMSMREQLDRLVLERGPIMWLIRA